jgi:hypothetical protein
MFTVFKKLVCLSFVMILMLFQLPSAALASNYSINVGNVRYVVSDASDYSDWSSNDTSNQSSDDFLNKCLFSQPDSGIGEVACGVGKATAVGGIIWGSCVAVDAVAAGFFPPAAALMPLCNVLGVGGAGQQALAGASR